MKREVHTRELQLMDAVRRKYLENQTKMKDVELKRMDDEIQRKVGFFVNFFLDMRPRRVTSVLLRISVNLEDILIVIVNIRTP